jgi:hypothetical protein
MLAHLACVSLVLALHIGPALVLALWWPPTLAQYRGQSLDLHEREGQVGHAICCNRTKKVEGMNEATSIIRLVAKKKKTLFSAAV